MIDEQIKLPPAYYIEYEASSRVSRRPIGPC